MTSGKRKQKGKGRQRVRGRERAVLERAEMQRADRERESSSRLAQQPAPPAAAPARQPRLRLEPEDSRASVLVAGSAEFGRFVRARLLGHAQARVAAVATTREGALYAAQHRRTDAAVVDADPQWLARTLGLVTSLARLRPSAAMVVVAPENFPVPPLMLDALQRTRWSLVVRRRTDDGRRLREAISSALIGARWVDPLARPEADGPAAR